MFVNELFESDTAMNTLVIYPGRFQPWHKGHKAVYDYLVKNFGSDNVFVATTNKVDPPRSPFTFSEKVQFMNLTGISADSIVETRDPYKALEVVQNYDPNTTRLIFAVSEKDMSEDPRFSFKTKKDGSPSYFQPMPNDASDMVPLKQHGYIMTVPTFNFTLLGQPMRSATEVRSQFAVADEATQQQIVKDLFGSYDKNVHDIMRLGLGVSTLNELKFPGSDDGERHEDNYPCYDCGSTIMGHHTRLCDLAEDWAVRDLPSLLNSQYWTGKIPKGLHPIAGLEDRGPTNEATDPKFVGFMNKALSNKADPVTPDTNMPAEYSNFEIMTFDNMPGYRPALKFGMSVLQAMDQPTREHFVNAPDDDLIVYMLDIAKKKGFMPKYFVEEDFDEVTDWFDEIFADPNLNSWNDLLKSMSGKPGIAESIGDKRTDPAPSKEFVSNKFYVKFTPTGIEFYRRGELVYTKPGDYSNPTRGDSSVAKSITSRLWEKEHQQGINEFAPIKPPTAGAFGGNKDYGQPTSSRYLGNNKFVVGTTNNYVLTATVDKWGLEWDDDDNIWYLDSPGAVYIADATEGEIELPAPQEQRNQIHDLVSDYLNARNSAELQRVAAYYGHSADGEMATNEGNLNEFVPPDGNGGGEDERSRRLRKLLEIAIQVAKEKNVDELGMIHAMNMIAGDEFFTVAVEGLLPDITDREYMYVLESAYKTVKQGLAEGMAQDEAEEYSGWRAEFVNQINYNTFEVKMTNTRSKESANFIVRPVDMISIGPTLQIETMDVHDLQTGRTESWTSDDPLPDGGIVYAIAMMFWDNKELQKKLWTIVDQSKDQDLMPGLDQRRSIGQEVDADAYIDSQEKTQDVMAKMKKGLAERMLD
jgi:hypothetical protein